MEDGARLVLFDADGVRAPMIAAWLRQMGWEADVLLEGIDARLPAPPAVEPLALPALEELEALGVRRLSAGSDLAQAAFAHVGALAGAFLQDGHAAPGERMAYGEVNALFGER